MPLPVRTVFLAVSALALALAGCATEKRQPEARGDVDPLLSSIMAEPIMSDRQLADQNQAGSAVTAAGPAAIELPPQPIGPDAVGTAKDEAAALAGGNIRRAPAATAPLRIPAIRTVPPRPPRSRALKRSKARPEANPPSPWSQVPEPSWRS